MNQKKRTKIASHRGGSLIWPENSREAFENSARLPLEQVEFDLHLTEDSKIVVIHDHLLDRTTNLTGSIQNVSWEELSQATLKGTAGERPLLFEEVIEIYRSSSVDLRVEIKPGHNMVPYCGLEKRAVKALKEQGMLSRTTITSFLLEVLETVMKEPSVAGYLWLVSPDVQRQIGIKEVITLAKSYALKELSFHIDHIDASVVDTVRSAGLLIGAWGAHREAQIRKAFDLEMEAFTSDEPKLAIKIRQEA